MSMPSLTRSLTLKIAFRNIFRQTRRSLLTGLTMTGGMVLLSMTMSITNGTYSNMINMFTRDHTGHIQIHRKSYLERPTLYKTIKAPEELEKLLAGMPDIRGAAPRIHGPALAFAKGKTTPAQLVGIDPEKESRTTLIREKLKSGDFVGARKDLPHGVMIGAGIAETLKLKVGEEIVLISQAADGSMATERYPVIGLIGTKESHERQSVYMTLKTAQEYFLLEGRVHEFALVVSHQNNAERVAEKLRGVLAKQSNAFDNLSVEPWQVVEEEFYKAMVMDRQGNSITMGIIVLIVAIGVLNTVLMTLLERTREYGVLKAVGTRPTHLFRLIVLETLILGTLSSILGILISIPVNLWFQEHGIAMKTPIDIGGIPYDRMLGELSMNSLLSPALLTIGTALLVSLYPALRAARIRPVDAMRSV